MENTKDEKLVAQFLDGDNEAFDNLLNRYLKPIYNFIFRLTRDLPSTEDLTQEVFIKVWKNLSRFNQNKSFKVWLFSIARNTAYDFLKKKKNLPFAFFEDEEGNSWISNIADEKILPNEILEKADLAKNIEKNLKKIPQNYQIILLMHYQDDFSLMEIAKILKKPYNTIKSQHQRALQRFKKLLV